MYIYIYIYIYIYTYIHTYIYIYIIDRMCQAALLCTHNYLQNDKSQCETGPQYGFENKHKL